MANYGKRMVPEYLIKGLEEAYAKTSGGTGSTINLLENIVDSKGNKRFIEGEGTPVTPSPTGITITKTFWSLSGTHLILVVLGSAANGTIVADGTSLAKFYLPKYIFDKIEAVWSTNGVASTNFTYVSDTWSTQDAKAAIIKDTDNLTITTAYGGTTLTTDKKFKIQFDLVINLE